MAFVVSFRDVNCSRIWSSAPKNCLSTLIFPEVEFICFIFVQPLAVLGFPAKYDKARSLYHMKIISKNTEKFVQDKWQLSIATVCVVVCTIYSGLIEEYYSVQWHIIHATHISQFFMFRVNTLKFKYHCGLIRNITENL